MRGRVQLVGFREKQDDGIFRVFGEIFVEKVKMIHLVTHHRCVAYSGPHIMSVIS